MKPIVGVFVVLAPLITVVVFFVLYSQSLEKSKLLKDQKGEDSVEYLKEVSRGRMYVASALGILAVVFGVSMVYVKVKSIK